jgi:hypothetical protein
VIESFVPLAYQSERHTVHLGLYDVFLFPIFGVRRSCDRRGIMQCRGGDDCMTRRDVCRLHVSVHFPGR